jgi:hypothetical protein
MAEPIGDESIYLRLDLLKKGLVQFTDATTAARLLARRTIYRFQIRANRFQIFVRDELH